jgi:hypothetical protein
MRSFFIKLLSPLLINNENNLGAKRSEYMNCPVKVNKNEGNTTQRVNMLAHEDELDSKLKTSHSLKIVQIMLQYY